MIKYKMIEIKNQNINNPNEVEAINQLSNFFPKNDIIFEILEDRLIIHLNQIDFSKLKNIIDEIIKNSNGKQTKILPIILKKIEDIKSYGLKGNKRLYVDYNKERKVKNRTSKEKKRGIHYYANSNDFSKQNNQISENFLNKIFCGDSEVILKQFPDNCIDCIITSPPYNFGLEYDSSEDDYKWDNYFNKLFAIFNECIRVLKYSGRIIVNIQPLFSDYIPTHHIISNFFMQKKLIWKGEILWEKNNYNCKYSAWGSWKSPSNPYLKYTWEFLEIFCKGTLKKSGLKKNIDIETEEFKKWVIGKWTIAPERKMQEFGHPAMFPTELVKRVVKLFTYKGDIILDPFNGVGTTTYVAKKLERKYIGIDISEDYCKKAIKRLSEKEDLQLKLF